MLQCKIYPVCQIYEHIKKINNPGKLQMDYMQYWADPPTFAAEVEIMYCQSR